MMSAICEEVICTAIFDPAWLSSPLALKLECGVCNRKLFNSTRDGDKTVAARSPETGIVPSLGDAGGAIVARRAARMLRSDRFHPISASREAAPDNLRAANLSCGNAFAISAICAPLA